MDIKDFEYWLKFDEKYSREIDGLIDPKRSVVIYYEDLLKNKNPVLKKVQEFLGVNVLELKSHFLRQNTHKLSECISNYWELKDKLKNTKYAKYFDE